MEIFTNRILKYFVGQKLQEKLPIATTFSEAVEGQIKTTIKRTRTRLVQVHPYNGTAKKEIMTNF
jgi:hypothetical protein